MTVASETSKISYAGDGSTDEFAVTFKYTAKSQIQAILSDASGDETIWVEDTQYTLTGAGASGTLTVSASQYIPAIGETLTIRRKPTLTQSSDYITGGGLTAEGVEADFDTRTIQVQWVFENVSRAPKLRAGSQSTTPTFPEPSAGKLVGWNSDGDDLENKAIADISDDLTSVSAPLDLTAGVLSVGTASESATGVIRRATVAIAGTGTNTDRAVTPAGLYPAYADVASATTTDIGAATTDKVRITGTTTITGFGTANAGIKRKIRFAAVLTLTHHATALILPSGANITTAANDCCEAHSLGSGNWIVVDYQRADGKAIVAGEVADDTSPTLGGDLDGDGNTIENFKNGYKDETGTTYEFLASDTGKVITFTNGSAITTTVPNDLPKGWGVTCIQLGAGQVTFSPEAGTTINNRQSHDKIAGQYGMALLSVYANSDNESATLALGGDTAS
jgi:hypothetical protein